jgi:ATP-binding cassette subfamily B protein
LIPYLGAYKGRAVVALLALIAAKGATVTVPLILREIVDALDKSTTAVLALPLGFLIAYGALRLGSTVFRELQKSVFARVRHGIMRKMSIRLLRHLHALSLRFHLNRKTGAITRDIDRGTRSISTMLNYLLFNIVPTVIELVMVASILVAEYSWKYAAITVVTLALYVVFTFVVKSWRMKFRVEMHQRDSEASSRAIDSLLNFETVKYFGNEEFEIEHYDEALTQWENVATRVQGSLSLLNAGQSLLIAAGVTVTMILAANQVVAGEMSIGDLVAVNAFLLQMFMPLGFLGTVYSILKNAASDMDRMFKLIEREPEIVDQPDAKELVVEEPTVRFEHVEFGYDDERQVLHDVDFEIPAGWRVAVVGPSGAGKSTIARLLFRFYEPDAGRVLIDGQDIRRVTQDSLRQHIGIVPQDTVLFNDSIFYNIQYGRLDATREEVERAADMAALTDFIESLPDGWETVVGERGLKLSGGEKQRVAIARAILKRPPILIFDEATSSLDSESEQAILSAMQEVSRDRTTLTIAHRLSTIVDSDEIIVMERGKVAERGTHRELLEHEGTYARLWALQQDESSAEDSDTGLSVAATP